MSVKRLMCYVIAGGGTLNVGNALTFRHRASSI